MFLPAKATTFYFTRLLWAGDITPAQFYMTDLNQPAVDNAKYEASIREIYNGEARRFIGRYMLTLPECSAATTGIAFHEQSPRYEE